MTPSQSSQYPKSFLNPTLPHIHIAGRTNEANKAFKELSKSMDDDESSKQWEQLSKEENTHEINSVQEPKDDALSIESISKEFFESNLTSYSITQQFEQKLKNKEIKWKGVIDRVQKFSFDLVFPNCKGVKASIVINEFESTMGNKSLRAIVQYPEDKIDMLKELKGKTVTFSGTMVKLDAFMYNIYIADGHIHKETIA